MEKQMIKTVLIVFLSAFTVLGAASTEQINGESCAHSSSSVLDEKDTVSIFRSFPPEDNLWEWGGDVSMFHKQLKKGELSKEAVEYGFQYLPVFKSYTLKAAEIIVDVCTAARTKQLFLLTASKDDEKNEYIIKVHKLRDESNCEAELNCLAALRKSDLLYFDLGNSSDPALPQIAFDIWGGYYEDEHKVKYYLSIFKKAPGKQIEEILIENIKEWEQSTVDYFISLFRLWGKTIGKFHAMLAINIQSPVESFGEIELQTLHGDLHNMNVFYDDDTKRFTLIDYSSFIRGKRSIQREIETIIRENSFLFSLLRKDLESFLPVTTSFIKEYSSVWPDSLQAKKYILSCMKQQIKDAYDRSEQWIGYLTGISGTPVLSSENVVDRETFYKRFEVLERTVLSETADS